MRPRFIASTLSLLFGLVLAVAQQTLHFDADIPVTHTGQVRDLAWSGGINFAQFGQLDLDLDGLKDLVYFDRSGNTLRGLRNTGGTGTVRYQVTRKGLATWPLVELHDWALFRDYNNDGKEDLFTYSLAGFAVYTNTSTEDELSFALLTERMSCEYVFTDGTSLMTNLYVSADDIPGLGDVDSDGDMDVLVFSQLGTYIQYFKNYSLENGYGTDSLQFVLRSNCWGHFAENASTNDVTLDTYCEFQVPSPEIGSEGQPTSGDEADRAAPHVGSTVTPIHLNGDGVMDLLLGDIAYPNLVALVNGGTTSSAHMVSSDEGFPSTDVPVNVPIFPTPYQLDVNGDAILDLLVCPSSRALANNYAGVWYYRNNGTNALPEFEFQQADLFQSRMLDFGEGALPILFDHNRDGLMDLIVANEGYYDPSGTYIGKLALLEQSPGPSFELVTTDYEELSASGIGMGMYPAFGDLDGDGDDDMYVGDLQGKLHHYRNIASGPVAEFQLVQPNVTYASGEVIDLGRHVTPLFIDLDGDGLLDLVAGEQNGNLNYLRNTGTSTAPAWTLATDSLGRVRTNTAYTLGFSVPHFFVNGSGERELLVGTETGTVWHYTGLQDGPQAAWSLVDSAYEDIDEGYRVGVALHDFTGDAEHDAVFGAHRGGLTFWRSDPVSAMRPRTIGDLWTVWPNPTSGQVSYRLPPSAVGGGTVQVVDARGRVVRSAPAVTGATIDLDGLDAGLYVLSYSELGGVFFSSRVLLDPN